jgi:hypothetical protein
LGGVTLFAGSEGEYRVSVGAVENRVGGNKIGGCQHRWEEDEKKSEALKKHVWPGSCDGMN